MEKVKYIQKNKKGKWQVSLTKTGKAIIVEDTQKKAIELASKQKNTVGLMVKRSSGWKSLILSSNDDKSKTKKNSIKNLSKKEVSKKTKTKKEANNKSSKAKSIIQEKKVKVSFQKITKKFGDLVANSEINFDVYDNEIHALLGENGAGKSTLMSILFGLYKPTLGSIAINGKNVNIKDPRHANELKIAMLPQHFKLVENMSVYENVRLGYEKLHPNGKADLEDIAKKFNINVDLNTKVEDLPLSDKQKVEILKILWRDAEIIIFDEPTSILTSKEIEDFLNLVKYMKKIGKTVLIITHKLNEIKAIADRVSIIRKGKYISTENVKSVSEKTLAELMVGEAVDLNLSSIKRIKHTNQEKVLEIENLNYKSDGYDSSLEDINISISKGEILGIAAIDGNGQSELIKSIAGIIKSNGQLFIEGQDVSKNSIKNKYFNYKNLKEMDNERINSYKDAISNFSKELKKVTKKYNSSKDSDEQKKHLKRIKFLKNQIKHTKILKTRPNALISHIPEDRHKYGLILDYSVSKNMILQDIDFYTKKFGLINKKDMNNRLKYLQEKYDIRGIMSPKTISKGLSGGNQQKLILAREIERSPKLLLAAHPTRGLDVGAIRNIYEKIIEARNIGMGVLLSSGELDEIMQVSDTIAVMHNGKIVSISKRGELSKQKLGSLMAGGK